MLSPTSRQDILHMLDNKIRVVLYNEIDQFKTLEELLTPFGSAVILYPNFGQPEVGHWCCIFCNTSGTYLEFFDSYGCYIDGKIKEYDDCVDKVSSQGFHPPQKIEPALLKLIDESKFNDNALHYNDVPYQNKNVDTNTCGLWCVMRLKNKHLIDDQFEKIYLNIPVSRNRDPDLVVSDIIFNLYPELRLV